MKNPSFALVVLLAVTTSGCGFSGQQFHGTYDVSGTVTMTITGHGSQTRPLAFTYRISEGAGSDIVITETSTSGGQCSYPAEVEGDVATVRPGTSCTQVANGVTVTRTSTNGTVVLSGKLVQFNLSGNLTLTGDGMSYPGTFIQNATLHQIGK